MTTSKLIQSTLCCYDCHHCLRLWHHGIAHFHFLQCLLVRLQRHLHLRNQHCFLYLFSCKFLYYLSNYTKRRKEINQCLLVHLKENALIAIECGSGLNDTYADVLLFNLLANKSMSNPPTDFRVSEKVQVLVPIPCHH